MTGFVKCIGGCPAAESSDLALHATSALTPFLILRAYAAGTTALTGVEAISDSVPAFRYPQSRNAATTLAMMGAISISMFLGISWLAYATEVRFEHGAERTVVAQIAHAVFAGGPMFYVVQVMTVAILILAANTAYQDFPRLISILAGDRFMPTQFQSRGDRLVFSNGIVILSLLACLLIWVFDADLNRLIQLYLVGVFLSFTASQSGMVMRWRRLKTPGWRKSAAINGFGGTVTGIVLVVVIVTKFTHGAWLVVVAIPILMFGMRAVHRHYESVAEELAHPSRQPVDRRLGNHHMVILVNRVDAATARAVGYTRSTRAADISAVTLDSANCGAWNRLAPEIPLTVLQHNRSTAVTLKAHLRQRRAVLEEADFLTIVIPEILESRGLLEVLQRPRLHRLKAKLIAEPGIQVLNVPVVKDEIDARHDQAQEPLRNHVCVLVSGVNNATLTAIEYAETLQATDIRGVTFALDPARSEALGNAWLDHRIPHPLEIEDAPFRELGTSLVHYLRRFHPNGVERVVTVVIPEFVVNKPYHHVLHGHSALLMKRHLLFERGVVVVSVPYHLGS